MSYIEIGILVSAINFALCLVVPDIRQSLRDYPLYAAAGALTAVIAWPFTLLCYVVSIPVLLWSKS